MTGSRHCLSLVKGRHRFVFVFRKGRERDLLEAFVDLANDPDSPFDWLDAAVLSYQIGKRVRIELDPVI